jgi:hypothetical protein
MNICFTTLVPPDWYDSIEDAKCNIIDVEQEENPTGPSKKASGDDEDVIDCNTPCPGQPSLYCDFEPTVDGKAIEWNGAEKTQCAKEWITYLITRFLEADAVVAGQDLPEFEGFQFNHVLNGELLAEGEERSDRWKLIVKDNKVSVKKGKTVYR